MLMSRTNKTKNSNLPKVINLEWLEDHSACQEGRDWFLEAGILDPIKGVLNLLAKDKLDWANWLVVQLMTHMQKAEYAVFAAKQVLKIFETEYPKDKRPRKAIGAALKYIKEPTSKNANAAYAAAYAAANAAYAAANAAANAAAYAAAYAANAAAYAAANAANAAANAALKIKIIKHGIKLLKRGY